MWTCRARGYPSRAVLHIHRASRADALADALAALLAQSPDDPFAPEVVAVPTRGMERWLTQRMSAVLGARTGRADGICANVEFPSPHRLVTDAVAAASGIDPAEDPWLPERSVWPLLARRAGVAARAVAGHAGGLPGGRHPALRPDAPGPAEPPPDHRPPPGRPVRPLLAAPPRDARRVGPRRRPRRRGRCAARGVRLAGRAVAAAARPHRQSRISPSARAGPASGSPTIRRCSTCPRGWRCSA